MGKVILRKERRPDHLETLERKQQETFELLCGSPRDGNRKPCVLGSLLDVMFQVAPHKYLDFISEEQLKIQVELFYEFLKVRPAARTNIRVFNPQADNLDFGVYNSTIVFINTPDKPFLVRSIYAWLAEQGIAHYLSIHPIINAVRDSKGNLVSLDTAYNDPTVKKNLESFIFLQIQHLDSADERKELVDGLTQLIDSLSHAVSDFPEMLRKTQEIQLYINTAREIDELARKNAGEFFDWLNRENFIFLGYRQYVLFTNDDGEDVVQCVNESGLGILHDSKSSKYAEPMSVEHLPQVIQERIKSWHFMTLDKSNSVSPVYERKNMDYIGVRQRISDSRYVEHVFLGLYSSRYFSEPVGSVDYLRSKLNRVLENKQILYKSYSYNKMFEVFNHYPKEHLFFIDPHVLGSVVDDLLNVISFERVKLIPTENLNARGQDLLLILPARSYSTNSLRNALTIIRERFQANLFEYRDFGDSTEAIKVYIYLVPGERIEEVSLGDLEQEIEERTMDWQSRLGTQLALLGGEGDHTSSDALLARYRDGFPETYRAAHSPKKAAEDIMFFERLCQRGDEQVNIGRRRDGRLNIRFYSQTSYLAVDLIGIFANLGIKVLSEQSFAISRRDGRELYVLSFDVEPQRGTEESLFEHSRAIAGTLIAAISGEIESDDLNSLSLICGLDHWQVVVLRGYLEYIFQVGMKYIKRTVWEALLDHADIANDLVQMFDLRFNPRRKLTMKRRLEEARKLSQSIQGKIEQVEALSEDYILRRFLNVVEATLRTSFYRGENQRRVLSFKLDSAQVMDMPLPRPMFEIFVYSPAMNGIHLRGGKVARGGLRWSDRPEDFRTEVLGLVATQMTKNAVIVPTGSKGGFVLRGRHASWEEQRAEADRQYARYIGALLEITDNIVEGDVVHPDNVVCHDGEDPYLVVAADKGTAHLSDTANGVSQSYGFWLGDAFASGGSYGYDHKKMGITAKGAWEAVKRHFREMGKNIQEEPFTVVGIGDMSGDVFGNGMLLSPHLRLIAAFNHKHIFIDPNPDTAQAFAERQRLFDLGRSGWNDYNTDLISKGGGIWERSAKRISLSAEAASALGCAKGNYAPDDLLSHILCANVELLWNGGIGTYIKASWETNESVGDKANDSLRVNGNQVRARVIGEGGNLGMTQDGRIEYAERGGAIFTDAIDNSAGVNASDHEVNIKILLQDVMNSTDMSFEQRNEVLESMTADVERLVLDCNYNNGFSIAIDRMLSAESTLLFGELIEYLRTTKGMLDCQTERIPEPAELQRYAEAGTGIPNPVLCKLTAYTRMDLYNELMDSELEWNQAVEDLYLSYFPPKLVKEYPEAVQRHKLRKEIACTLIANKIVDQAGATFLYNLVSTTSATPAEVARAYIRLEHFLGIDNLRRAVFDMDNQKDSAVQYRMLIDLEISIRRGVRWLVTKSKVDPYCGSNWDRLFEAFGELNRGAEQYLPEAFTARFTRAAEQSAHIEHSRSLTEFIEKSRYISDMLSISYVSARCKADIGAVVQHYLAIKEQLSVESFRQMVYSVPLADVWDRKARNTLVASIGDRVEGYCMQALEQEDFRMNTQGYSEILDWVREHGLQNFNPLFIALRGLQ